MDSLINPLVQELNHQCTTIDYKQKCLELTQELTELKKKFEILEAEVKKIRTGKS